MNEVFFYGLFMDETLLREKGIRLQNPRKASLLDYELRIGERATLLPSPGNTSYGMLMQIPEADLEILYSDKSVADYMPEKVIVHLNDGQSLNALCYNLPAEKVSGSNIEYAQSLHSLAKSIGLPSSYLDRIEEFAKASLQDNP